MNEPLFLTKEEVLAYHAQQLALFGGQSGLGDEGLLESAWVQAQIRLTTSHWDKERFAGFLRSHSRTAEQ